MKRLGFSLSEVFIAVMLPGLITAFTLLNGFPPPSEHAQRAAVFKETLAHLQQVMDQGMQDHHLKPENTWAYFRTKLHATQVCESNANTEGCWPQAGGNWERGQPGFVLENGTSVMGIDGGTDGPLQDGYNYDGPLGWGDCAMLDWNGSKLPNEEGQDQLFVCLSFGKTFFQGIPAGQIAANYDFPVSESLYCDIFSCSQTH